MEVLMLFDNLNKNKASQTAANTTGSNNQAVKNTTQEINSSGPTFKTNATVESKPTEQQIKSQENKDKLWKATQIGSGVLAGAQALNGNYLGALATLATPYVAKGAINTGKNIASGIKSKVEANSPMAQLENGMSYEEAQALANERYNPQYQQSLQDTLDKINVNAAKSGFYGQLPVEALKQQAAAAVETDKNTAIQQLAQALLENDQNYNLNKANLKLNQNQLRSNIGNTIFNNTANVANTLGNSGVFSNAVNSVTDLLGKALGFGWDDGVSYGGSGSTGSSGGVYF